MELKQAIEQANQSLERISLRQKAGKLYIRGRTKDSFPAKPDGNQVSRAEIRTQYSASPSGLKLAMMLAKKIEAELLWNQFDWNPYLRKDQRPPESVGEWVTKYEAHHWATTPTTPTKQNSYHKNYRLFFARLPQEKPLTLNLLRQTIITESSPATRSREFFCMAYRKLAEFAAKQGAIDPAELATFKAELKELKRGYQPKPIIPEDLPTDEEIIAIWEGIQNPGWKWIYGMLATYGLRPSEVFRLDLERFTQDTEVVRVLEATKTGTRLAYPVLPSWRSQFKLWEVHLPKIQRIDNRSNNELGEKISWQFIEMGIAHSPYKLRHAWAIRTVLVGAPDTIGAKWAGHSVSIRTKTYHQALSQGQHQQIFDQIKEAEKILRDGD